MQIEFDSRQICTRTNTHSAHVPMAANAFRFSLRWKSCSIRIFINYNKIRSNAFKVVQLFVFNSSIARLCLFRSANATPLEIELLRYYFNCDVWTLRRLNTCLHNAYPVRLHPTTTNFYLQLFSAESRAQTNRTIKKPEKLMDEHPRFGVGPREFARIHDCVCPSFAASAHTQNSH